MGLIKWIMKGIDVEKDNNFLDEQTQTTVCPTETDIDTLKEIASREQSEQVTSFDNMSNTLQQTNNVNANNAINQYFENGQNTCHTSTQTVGVYNISNQEDIKSLLRQIGKKATCMMSYKNVNKKQIKDLKLFLDGGLFALGANIIELQDNFFLVVSRGVEVQKSNTIKG